MRGFISLKKVNMHEISVVDYGMRTFVLLEMCNVLLYTAYNVHIVYADSPPYFGTNVLF